nr:hypothetical protein CFP56_02746 [Quercus suber]
MLLRLISTPSNIRIDHQELTMHDQSEKSDSQVDRGLVQAFIWIAIMCCTSTGTTFSDSGTKGMNQFLVASPPFHFINLVANRSDAAEDHLR